MTENPRLSETLDAAWRAYLRSERRTGKIIRTHVWASMERECTRAMALDLLHPEDQPEWSDEQLGRFKRGNERERSVMAMLGQIGPEHRPPFEVIGGQESFEVTDRDGTLLITGKIDGRLRMADGRRPIVEVKSGDSVRNIERFEDFERSPWTRKMPAQLLTYMLAKNEPDGLFIIDKPGIPTFIEVRLLDHLERPERFLQKARIAVDARFGRAPLPDFIDRPEECRRCDHFGKTCAPPVTLGDALSLVTDEYLIAAAETKKATQEAANANEKATETLKKALRGIPEALVGPYVVRGKWQPDTKYEIPADVKAQYAKRVEQGKWMPKFEEHGIAD